MHGLDHRTPRYRGSACTCYTAAVGGEGLQDAQAFIQREQRAWTYEDRHAWCMQRGWLEASGSRRTQATVGADPTEIRGMARQVGSRKTCTAPAANSLVSSESAVREGPSNKEVSRLGYAEFHGRCVVLALREGWKPRRRRR
ncbi:hypothetical protein C8Q80DRAFT_731139 [Daedaleopsis nitida]|nr:hypothetical protein C8Q80DRAFT_731139 [Daedaleopsis nitida]